MRTARVLVIDDDDRLARKLESILPAGSDVSTDRTAWGSAGEGVDVVVIAGTHPIADLTSVRVHPRLFDRPVVMAAGRRALLDEGWPFTDVTAVTRADGSAVAQVAETVRRLLLRVGSRRDDPASTGGRR